MTVTTTSPAAGVTRTTLDQSTKLSAALNVASNASVSSTNSNAETRATVAVETETSALSQSSTVSFRLDSLNIALAGTKVDVVDSGAAQVSRLLGQLASVASQATTSGLSESALELLNGQFQALRLAINNVPPGPPGAVFTVQELAEGFESAQDAKAKVGGFSDTALLGDANLSTAAAAQAAVSTIADASKAIDAQRVILSNLQAEVDFAAATVDTAIQNQDALRSTLSADDVSGKTATASLAASLQADQGAAIAAQTARLPENILKLLSQ